MTDEHLINGFVRFIQPSPLAVPFLAIMFGLLFYGVHLYRTLRREILSEGNAVACESSYRASRGDHGPSPSELLEPQRFIDIYFEQDVYLIEKMSFVPSGLVTIGILGTFVGLGLAVGDAARVLHPGADYSAMQSGLRELLAAVGFKFQTSVYGVLLSLFYQFAFLRQALKEKEFFLDRLARERLLPHYRPAGVQIREMVKAVDRLPRVLGQQLEGLATMLQDSISGPLKQFSDKVAVMAGETEKVGNAAYDLAQAGQRLSTLDKSIEGVLKRLGSTVDKQLEESRNVFKQIPDALEQLQGDLQESLNTMSERTIEIQEQAKEYTSRINGAIEDSNEVIAGFRADLSRLIDLFEKMESITTAARRASDQRAKPADSDKSTDDGDEEQDLGLNRLLDMD